LRNEFVQFHLASGAFSYQFRKAINEALLAGCCSLDWKLRKSGIQGWVGLKILGKFA